MSYPAFRRFSEDELHDHFFLGPEEVALARSLRYAAHRRLLGDPLGLEP